MTGEQPITFTATVERLHPSGAPAGHWRPAVRHPGGFFVLDNDFKCRLGHRGTFTAHLADQFAHPVEWLPGEPTTNG